MLKDFAKTSPVTFFALPIIIIGMLVLSYFLYSTLITNQIDSRQKYVSKQLELSTQQLEGQIVRFKKEFPYLADLDDFGAVFNQEDPNSGKLRYRLKRIVNRYNLFVDTLFIYTADQYYFISCDKKGFIEEGYGALETKQLPLQFTNKPKMLHLEGSKMLLMSPLRIGGENEVYLGAVMDMIAMISDEANRQYTGEFSSKIVFTENLGFSCLNRGKSFDSEFNLLPQNKKTVINNLLENQSGFLLHSLPKSSKIYLSCYQPFKIFKERFGLIFVLSEDDFVAPIKVKLQVIFISFFTMIAIILIVFIISLKDISRNTDELYQSKKSLSQTLAQQRLILEHGETFSFTLNKNRKPIYVTDNLELITGYSHTEWFELLPELLEKNNLNHKLPILQQQQVNQKDPSNKYILEVIKPNGKTSIIEFKERTLEDKRGKVEAITCTGKDITEAFFRRLELRQTLSILEAQQEAVKDGIFITDEFKSIISCNTRLVNMFALGQKPSADDTASSVLEEIVAFSSEKNELKKLIDDAIKNPHRQVQYTFSTVNGHFYDFYSAPILEPESPVAGRIWTFRNVSEQKRQIEELTLANERAKEGAREKENFLSTMSHEIRTPLNSILGFTNLLIQGKPRSDQEELITPLKYSADSLLGLINDILDLTKIDGGNIQFENIPFNTNEKMIRAREVFLQKAEEKNVGIQLSLDETIPSVLLGDYNRLNQIIYNLLSNAVKFTETGMIELGTKAKGSNSTGSKIQFWIKDSGIGIAPKNHKRIFESFSQADSNTTREYGGTGLGLAITKKLVELQGGGIWVESELGKGATFFVELFFGKTSKKAEQEANVLSKDELTALSDYNVLVVEDNPFNQKVVEKFLSNWEVDTTLVDSGEEALEVITSQKFDLILMDLQMPGMDGYETSQSIRSMKGAYYTNLPIIAMSADALGDVKEKVANAGMNSYLSKPFDPAELYNLIASITK